MVIRFLLAGFFAATVSALALAQERPERQYTIETFLDTIEVRGASFSPDGEKILVSSYWNGVLNAFAIPIDGSDSERLTDSTEESIYTVSYFPEDERFIYVSDEGGNELTHVYVREIDGTVTDITPGEGLKASFVDWAEDDQSFYIVSNERDPNYFDLYEVAAGDYSRTMIFENDTGYNIADISADERFVALQRVETRARSHVLVYDRETGETRPILQHEGDIVCSPQTFTKKGHRLLCLTDKDSEFLYLVEENLESGESIEIERPDWDVMYARYSPKGQYLVVAVNEDSRTALHIQHALSGREIYVPKVDDGHMSAVVFNRDETAIAFYVQGGRTPGDLYYYKMEPGEKPVRLTQRLSRSIDPDDLVEPRVVRFTSYDGTDIPGILYEPHQASRDDPAPALVYVHGGPGGQTRISWNPYIQYLVNHGYVVYGINNRGSSGYGKTFFAMDDLKHGSADLDDCVASKQMLIDTGFVDPDRIGIMGGSYGGYMVCAALAFRPEAFEAGVDIFGVTNWVRTLKSIPKWWTATRDALYEELGDPTTQEDHLRRISPLFHAHQIRRPLIVLQGANDPRVLKVESDEMVAAVRANGVPVEYLIFDDEGHGFRKKQNQIDGYKAILKFLDTHLKAGGRAAAAL